MQNTGRSCILLLSRDTYANRRKEPVFSSSKICDGHKRRRISDDNSATSNRSRPADQTHPIHRGGQADPGHNGAGTRECLHTAMNWMGLICWTRSVAWCAIVIGNPPPLMTITYLAGAENRLFPPICIRIS